jgi:putative ATPase
MKDLGYGKGYVYEPDTPDGFSGQNFFPDGTGRHRFYLPRQIGYEKTIAARLEYWEGLRAGVDDKS